MSNNTIFSSIQILKTGKTMSVSNIISLIDLSKQFPFEIDDNLKEELCFGETLVISCGHYEDAGAFQTESSLSETTTSIKSEDEGPVSNIVIPPKDYEVKDAVIEETQEDDKPVSAASSENDFHFFFFPDCDEEPKVSTSQDSIVIVDGLPKKNVDRKVDKSCFCEVDEHKKCVCFAKMPCKCLDPKNPDPECHCSKLENICICRSNEILPVCTCGTCDICICYPDKILPVCKCCKATPCVCHLNMTYPTCICGESQPSENVEENKEAPNTCLCNVSEGDGGDGTSACHCDVRLSKENISDSSSSEYWVHCTCGNSKDCKCFYTCKCELPCICEYIKKHRDEQNVCKCLEQKRASKDCREVKLKKIKVSKDKYRWCNDVDPYHTFFDFGYGQHDKIDDCDGPDIIKKIKILGLHDKFEKEQETINKQEPIPKYKKKKCGPCLDCCSVVGGISIIVEVLGEERNTFLVQVVSNAMKEGSKTGTQLVSIVDSNLHTLEENRIESVTKGGVMKEKRSYIAICDTGYYNKITRIFGDRNTLKRFYHTFEDAHDFILEGANIILMRYFGLRRYKGTVKNTTILINGTICENIYLSHGVSQAVVNGKPFFVVKVERHIIEPSGYLHQSMTVLSLRGHIVSHEWADSCHILHLNPLLNVIPEKDQIERHEPLREHWRDDLQLLSDYLDFKSKRTSEGARYAAENGPLAATIRDYLQSLLILRPSDALQFTRTYFGTALSSLDLPHNPYFDTSAKGVRYYFYEQ